MYRSNFSLIDRFRNKIRVDKSTEVAIGKNSKIVNCTIVVKGKNNTLKIGANSKLRASTIEIIGNNCEISIGEGSLVGHNSYLSAKEESISLIIGDKTALSRNIKVMTSDGHPIFQNNQRINHAKNIIIEDGVWIADSVTILKGVTIKKGSVVGINSTVTKDIPKESIAVGNPCVVVKEDITWTY
ncbi:acyltransferase [Sulfurimonas sp.]|jgi:acetyltransferase-like isoleucine patch superfamily enzyme|uniref:acyltransferase n=1 Tax=Sulfurimonas sp. TaxID=2022749 RepID=UPI0025D59FC2|nr:acyltransferase [Sulfurimonas sp.]MCK9473425.1 acyltransferase [Sulfurimonas sp.]MDD3505380.1 acyltransferase [Sulfurimonas sp.]